MSALMHELSRWRESWAKRRSFQFIRSSTSQSLLWPWNLGKGWKSKECKHPKWISSVGWLGSALKTEWGPQASRAWIRASAPVYWKEPVGGVDPEPAGEIVYLRISGKSMSGLSCNHKASENICLVTASPDLHLRTNVTTRCIDATIVIGLFTPICSSYACLITINQSNNHCLYIRSYKDFWNYRNECEDTEKWKNLLALKTRPPLSLSPQQRIGGKSPRPGVLFAVTAAYKNSGHDHKVIKT